MNSISCFDNWGQYVPEPTYHFEEFSTTPKIIGKNKDGEVIVDDSENIINKRTSLPLSIEEITEGISIGIKLKQKNKEDGER